MQNNRHFGTGHFDCAGEMIHRHDRVYTPAGLGAILWVNRGWVLRYEDRTVEKLNQYSAAQLRRLASAVR